MLNSFCSETGQELTNVIVQLLAKQAPPKPVSFWLAKLAKN